MAPTNADGDSNLKCPAGLGASSLAGTSLADATTLVNPTGYYSVLRRDDPVHYDAKLDMYLVSRYEELQAVLRDPITFSLELGYNRQFAQGLHQELKDILVRDGGGYFPDVIMTDPPRHSRIRRLMDKAFTAHRVKLLEPALAELAGRLIDQVSGQGQADGVADFAMPMTIRFMCEQLGLRHADADKVHRWSQAYIAQLGLMQSREQMLGYARDICELQHYIIDRVRERQSERREDMISDLVYAQLEDEENPTLAFGEVVALARALLVGGNDTTATAIANLLFIVATQPQVAQLLYDVAEDDQKLARFVEELLRLEPPVHALSRITTREVELGGQTLPAGVQLLLLFASGNDDENEFSCPRAFDPYRKNLLRHLTFGAGTHLCIGMSLARMEIRVAAREIARRLDNIRLAAPNEEVRYVPAIAMRTMASLPLAFSRRAGT